VLIPGPGDWNPIRIGAVAAAGAAGIVEQIFAGGRPRVISDWLLPTLDSTLGSQAVSSDDIPEMDDATVQRLVYGESNDAGIKQHVPTKSGDLTAALTILTRQLASLTGQLARLEVAVNK
jgi:hypothetical protein